ncbi:Type 1 secretion, target domain protein [Candidatus Magnetomorum sp. HK-1]|nr:Type 1 secretion, target domain protein [Candidatus Magnetomorum sp. HK-1]
MKNNKYIDYQSPIINCFMPIIIFSIIINQLLIINCFASIPEPNVQIYGKVYNTYNGDKELMTQGSIECTLKKKGIDGVKFSFNTNITCMKCTEYVNGECQACLDYLYKLEIPQKTADKLLATNISNNDVTLNDDTQQYDYVKITVDGKAARVLPLWNYGNKSTHESGIEFILASQSLRSHYYRVDLEIVNHQIDSDSDGIPDYWEDMHNLDKNNPADALLDLDNDTLINLQEYEKKGDPNLTNLVPRLDEKRHPISVTQNGRSIITFHVLDADSNYEDIIVELKTTPAGGMLLLKGGSEKVNTQGVYEDKVLQQGDFFSVDKVKNGLLHFIHTNISIDDCSFDIAIKDKTHDSLIYTLDVKVWAPTRTDGTDARYWADMSRNTSNIANGQILEVMNDYSGSKLYNETEQKWMELHSVESTNTAIVNKNESQNGNPVLKFDGNTYFNLSHTLPVFPDSDITLFAVFKTIGSVSQNLISSPYFQLGLTGSDHHSHPGELELSTPNGSVYGNLPVKDKWVIAGVARSSKKAIMEIEGVWTGGPYIHDEITNMATGPQIGAKGIWKWNVQKQDYEAKYTDGFEGNIGEMLFFVDELSFTRKWRTVAYLLSKWFGHVVYDGSNESQSIIVKGASASYSEFQYYNSDFVVKYGHDYRYIIIGGSWKDELIGGHEDDILIGNSAEDIFYGKGGKDLFVVGDGDIIADFYEPDKDRINLVHLFKRSNTGDIFQYIHFETDGTDTHLFIDENGDGSGFTDAKITIRHNVYRDLDIPRLWAEGYLITGGIRPHLTVAIHEVTNTSTEVTKESATFEIRFSESHVPKNLTVVLHEQGDATVGEDFVLETDIYNTNTGKYDRVVAIEGVVPIQLKPGSTTQTVWVVPIVDGKKETDETLLLSIGDKGEYFDIAENNNITVTIKDGKDIVGIKAISQLAYESCEICGKISIFRAGSISEPLVVQLDILGTAINGEDYTYLPSEVMIPAGKNEIIIDVSPIQDSDAERDEFVEIIIKSKERYLLRDSISALVTITDKPILKGDINVDGQIGIDDLIICFQVLTGLPFKPGNCTKSDITGDRKLGIQDAVNMMIMLSDF